MMIKRELCNAEKAVLVFDADFLNICITYPEPNRVGNHILPLAICHHLDMG